MLAAHLIRPRYGNGGLMRYANGGVMRYANGGAVPGGYAQVNSRGMAEEPGLQNGMTGGLFGNSGALTMDRPGQPMPIMAQPAQAAPSATDMGGDPDREAARAGNGGFGSLSNSLGLGSREAGNWNAGGILGTALGLGLGIPGAGSIGTAIDAGRANAQRDAWGKTSMIGEINPAKAALNSATFGLLGQSIRDQWNAPFDAAVNQSREAAKADGALGPTGGLANVDTGGWDSSRDSGGWGQSDTQAGDPNGATGGGGYAFRDGGVVRGYADGGAVRPRPLVDPRTLLASLTEREMGRSMRPEDPAGRMTMPPINQTLVHALMNNRVRADPYEGAVMNMGRVARGQAPMGPQPQGNVTEATLQQLLEETAATTPENRQRVHRNMGHMARYDSLNPTFGPYDPPQQDVPAMADGGSVGGSIPEGSFVIPAAVVAALGEGSTEVGMQLLQQMFGAQQVQGPGTGRSDSVEFNNALLSNGEAVVPPEGVAAAGGPEAMHSLVDAGKQRLAELAQTPPPRGYAEGGEVSGTPRRFHGSARDPRPNPEMTARIASGALETLLGILPGSGEVMSAQDGYRQGRQAVDQARSGDYGGALSSGAGALASYLAAAPVVGALARAPRAAAKALSAMPSAAGLPMDDAARMARADDLGFRTTVYRGEKSGTLPSEYPAGAFFSKDPETATGFAQQGGQEAAREFRVKMNRPFQMEGQITLGDWADLVKAAETPEEAQRIVSAAPIDGDWTVDRFLRVAQADNNRGVPLTSGAAAQQLLDLNSDGYRRLIERAGFDAIDTGRDVIPLIGENIRHISAAFDPARASSRNIFHSAAPVIGAGGLAAMLAAQGYQE